MQSTDRPSPRSATHRARVSIPLALLAAGAASCVEIRRVPGVMLATTPPGARVMVDGVDSGFVTPCHLDLSRSRHDLDLVLEGYKPVSVAIEEGGQTTLVFWDEAWIYPNTWRFPLWLNARDGFFPVKVEHSYSPARIYAPLKLADLKEAPRRGRTGRKP